MKLTIKTTDKQDHPLDLPGAEPTLGELRTEAKRLGDDLEAQGLKEQGIEDGSVIIVVVNKAKPAESPGVAASPAAAVPSAAVPWAPSPSAAVAAAAAPSPAPGAQPKAPTDLFGGLENPMQGFLDEATRLLQQVAAEPGLLLCMQEDAPSLLDALKTGDPEMVAKELHNAHLFFKDAASKQAAADMCVNATPSDIEAQKKIEERIRRHNVNSDWAVLGGSPASAAPTSTVRSTAWT